MNRPEPTFTVTRALMNGRLFQVLENDLSEVKLSVAENLWEIIDNVGNYELHPDPIVPYCGEAFRMPSLPAHRPWVTDAEAKLIEWRAAVLRGSLIEITLRAAAYVSAQESTPASAAKGMSLHSVEEMLRMVLECQNYIDGKIAADHDGYAVPTHDGKKVWQVGYFLHLFTDYIISNPLPQMEEINYILMAPLIAAPLYDDALNIAASQRTVWV